ncbi:MAG: hypothetical protein NT062_17705, partial [Proteobacteria bacterium]|nr:hypothetical protein [Pseudomonadota bacterium]
QVPAEIHADGTVTFHDRGDFEIHFALPRPSRKAIGAAIADWYEDPYAQTRYRAVQEMAPHEQAVEGGWDAGAGGDGRPSGKAEGPGHPSGGPAIPILGGSFDVTAWAMRKFGAGDPYQARKAKLLDATFAQRAELGAQQATSQLARSSVIARDNLAWLASIHDPAERRAAVFAMWDECDEGNGGDDARGQAGDRARVMIVGWIRTHAARGTAAGFTAAEIATFDAQRTSRQHFAPY